MLSSILNRPCMVIYVTYENRVNNENITKQICDNIEGASSLFLKQVTAIDGHKINQWFTSMRMNNLTIVIHL